MLIHDGLLDFDSYYNCSYLAAFFSHISEIAKAIEDDLALCNRWTAKPGSPDDPLVYINGKDICNETNLS